MQANNLRKALGLDNSMRDDAVYGILGQNIARLKDRAKMFDENPFFPGAQVAFLKEKISQEKEILGIKADMGLPAVKVDPRLLHRPRAREGHAYEKEASAEKQYQGQFRDLEFGKRVFHQAVMQVDADGLCLGSLGFDWFSAAAATTDKARAKVRGLAVNHLGSKVATTLKATDYEMEKLVGCFQVGDNVVITSCVDLVKICDDGNINAISDHSPHGYDQVDNKELAAFIAKFRFDNLGDILDYFCSPPAGADELNVGYLYEPMGGGKFGENAERGFLASLKAKDGNKVYILARNRHSSEAIATWFINTEFPEHEYDPKDMRVAMAIPQPRKILNYGRLNKLMYYYDGTPCDPMAAVKSYEAYAEALMREFTKYSPVVCNPKDCTSLVEKAMKGAFITLYDVTIHYELDSIGAQELMAYHAYVDKSYNELCKVLIYARVKATVLYSTECCLTCGDVKGNFEYKGKFGRRYTYVVYQALVQNFHWNDFKSVVEKAIVSGEFDSSIRKFVSAAERYKFPTIEYRECDGDKPFLCK